MDAAFRLPGGFRIGWDWIIGLIPGFWDFAGLAMSSYIILKSIGMGVPRSVIARMSLNVMLETLIGSIPILGDLFDIAFKANLRNTRLLEKYKVQPDRTRTRSRFWISVYVIAALAILALAMYVAFRITAWLFEALF